MTGFIQVFTTLLLVYLVIELIGFLYPETKNKHTLLIAFSIISIYVCLNPVLSLMDSLKPARELLQTRNTHYDKSEFAYESEFMTALEKQVADEIREYLKTEFLQDAKVSVLIGGENALTVTSVMIFCDDKFEKEGEIGEYIRNRYGVTPSFEIAGKMEG